MRRPSNKSIRSRSTMLFVAAALLCGIFFVQETARGDEPPTFRRGMWTFHRTMSGKNMEMTKCADPSENVLQKNGCTLSSVKKSGQIFTFTADCPPMASAIPELGGRTTVTLDVVSDSFYKAESDGLVNGQPVKEFLDARRIGDCAK